MPNVSYSTRGNPSVDQVSNVNLDYTTLVAGQALIYDATNELWVNGAGGGGGAVVGVDDEALFKQAGVANTYTNGISRNPAVAGKTMVLDTTNLRVGIGGAGVAQNPSESLCVHGIAIIDNGVHQIKLNNARAETTSAHNLELGGNNVISFECGQPLNGLNLSRYTLKLQDPTLFDVGSGDITIEGLTKMKLQAGNATLKQAGGANYLVPTNPAFGFPQNTSNFWLNNKLANSLNCIIGRSGTSAPIAAAGGVRANPCSFGSVVGVDFSPIYDPLNYRSTANPTFEVECPEPGRSAGLLGIWKIHFFLEGQWNAPATGKCDVFADQYRGGVGPLRSFIICSTTNLGLVYPTDPAMASGERLIMGMATYGEDFIPATDSWQFRIVNNDPVATFQHRLSKVSCEFLECP